MPRAITNEISYAEMLQMRQDGMSNQEIAKSLDISYNTVLRYIGRQPKNVDGRQYAVRPCKSQHSDTTGDDKIIDLVPVEHADNALNLIERMSVYRGENATYTVCSNEMFITMEIDGQSVRLRKEALSGIAREFIAIQNAMAVGQL